MKRTTGSPKNGLAQDLPDSFMQLRLHKDFAFAINQADDTHQTFSLALRLICELTGWQSGRASFVDPENRRSPNLFVEWPPTTGEHHSAPGSKLVYSIPVPVSGTTGALLEFTATSEPELPPDFPDMLAEVGLQLGKILDRQRSLEQLRARERLLHQLVESVKDFAFYTLDLDGNITSWNKGAEKVKGYKYDEIIGRNFTLFHTPEAIAANRHQKALDIARQEGRFETEDWRVRKDGSVFWADVVIFPIYNSSGVLQGYTKLTRDLTKRKLIETQLQETQARHQIETAELRRRLMDGKEVERLHMAQELHDGPIQDLYGLIFGLDAIVTKVRSQTALVQLDVTKRRLQQVISTLRGMISDLRPPTLAPFGLEKAIRSHIQNFREAHPEIQIELVLDSDRRTLPEDLRLALFRIYQSSLANIVRHAEASQVTIRLILEDERVLLEIQDNGKGFTVPERWIKLVREGHLGLVGARERAEAVGGTFEVESIPGEGTLVKATVPREGIEPELQNGSGRE